MVHTQYMNIQIKRYKRILNQQVCMSKRFTLRQKNSTLALAAE